MTRDWRCWLVLRLYPASFRKRYGREITDTILDLRDASSASRLRFWARIGIDACRAAAEQRVDEWKQSGRATLRWIAACTIGAAAWKAIGTAFGWLFAYFYHPYLEGAALSPWLYGATLGAALGATQCLIVRKLPAAIWIAMSAAFAAVGLQVAVVIGSFMGPLSFGAVVGIAVACGQWIVLRERFQRAGLLAALGGSVLSMAALSVGVAMHRAPFAANALNHFVIPVDPGPFLPMQALYAPMNWTEWTMGLAAIATSGLVVGAITAKPVSSVLSDAC